MLNCQAGGGVGAIIYNNEAGQLYGTLGGVATSLPSVGISDSDGAAMSGQVGQSATVSVEASNYAYFDGTSMASPHVAGVAALVWSYHPGCHAGEIRAALQASAEDLGAAGRDDAYGHGLVKAAAAVAHLNANACTGTNPGGGGGDGGGGGGDCKGGPKKCG